MIIGIPREVKPQENRVSLTPASVDTLVRAGHAVWVEQGAGNGSGFADAEYEATGARIAEGPAALFDTADLVIKVKEPQPSEFELLREGQVLFTFLHLAADAALTEALLQRRIIGIAYETVQLPDGSLPLLAPMSAIAGRMAVQVGAHLLEKVNGGRGILLGGVPGVERGRVVVIGGGHVGTNAIKMAAGLGAQVTVLDISPTRLDTLDDLFGGRIETLMSNDFNIGQSVRQADLVIGAVLVPGARAPKLVKEYMVRQMRPGSVLIDVAIDQGGSIETIDRRTTHEHPYFIKHGIVHYSVANMPGAVPRTATFALANATLPYVLKLANRGPKRAMLENAALLRGLNVHQGALTCQAVAESLSLPFTEAGTALGAL